MKTDKKTSNKKKYAYAYGAFFWGLNNKLKFKSDEDTLKTAEFLNKSKA